MRKERMKIIIATCGSRGDVQPMVALTLALDRAGHDCMLLGPPEKAIWARRLGCRYIPFGPDVTAFIAKAGRPYRLPAAWGFHRMVQDALIEQLEKLAKWVENADLLVAASLVFGASTIAEIVGIPYGYVVFSPQLLPSQHHPFPLVRTQTLPQSLNRLSWQAASVLDMPSTLMKLNRFRKKAGLNPIKNAWCHILGEKTLLACDQILFKIPDDVKGNVVQTGSLHLDSPEKLKADIKQFIESRKDVIFAGFGSMPGTGMKDLQQILIRAAGKHHVSLILMAPWQKQEIRQVAPDVLSIKQAPHSRLFPAMKAVIHHGGAGTTAAAARAGVPQIIVPHILDQYYHAHQIWQLKLGPRPIRHSRLNAQAILFAVGQALEDQDLIDQAKRIGQAINPEKSLVKAVTAVKNLGKR